MADLTKKSKRARLEPVELTARAILAALGVAALVLAAIESHEAIGTALVGAAIAFGLSAAFFDRVLEVSTKGVKLADIRAMEVAVDQEAPQANPEEKEALVAEGSEILARKRSVGEKITPDLALREASLSWERNGLAIAWRVSIWLLELGWIVHEAEQYVATVQPDLVAERNGRQLAIEIKAGRRPVGVDAIRQVLAQAASVEAVGPMGADRGPVQPVLILGEIPLTSAATEMAADRNVSVYLLDPENKFTHLIGPELD